MAPSFHFTYLLTYGCGDHTKDAKVFSHGQLPAKVSETT